LIRELVLPDRTDPYPIIRNGGWGRIGFKGGYLDLSSKSFTFM